MDDYQEQAPAWQQAIQWPDTWGEDPIPPGGRRYNVYGDLMKALTTGGRKQKDPSEWEVFWQEGARWTHGADDDLSPALVALDSCLYAASKGSAPHVQSLIRGFERGWFPSHPVQAWKERWMRSNFVNFLMETKPGSEQRKLAEIMIDRWTWAFAWSGQEKQNYGHPLIQALRHGHRDLAEKMMGKIPAEEWLQWSNPYDLRSAWREGHWRQGDVSWFNAFAAYDPRILAISPKEGMGPLEMACKEGAAEVVDKLLSQGMRPDPLQSFGLSLSHWVVHGLSHSRWNAKRQEFEEKSAEQIATDAQACGRTLAVLARHGFDMDTPVVKMKPIPGFRRPGKLPKAPETASQVIQRKLENALISASTVACLQQAYMLESSKDAPAPSTTSRPRL